MQMRDLAATLRGRKLSVGIAGVVLLIGLVVGVAWWYGLIFDTGAIPRKYQHGWQFSLFTPNKLPAGYAVDRKSFQRKDGVLIFSLSAPGGKNVAVSEQSAPPGGVPQPSTPPIVTIPGQEDFETPAGQAHVALWGDKYVCDITTTTGTWIILNVTGFTADQATAVASSFTRL